MAMNSLKDYISTKEASEKYQLSKEHIARMLKAGKLQGRKIGHDWLVYEPSLKEYSENPPKPGPKSHGKKGKST